MPIRISATEAGGDSSGVEPGTPALHYAPRIILDVAGGVGVGAVGDDLHQRLAVAPGQTALEVLRDHHIAAQRARYQRVGDFAAIVRKMRIQHACARQGGGQRLC